MLRREKDKLEKSLGGIKHMEAPPDVIFIVDVGHEDIAILEAKKLGIPVVAVVDTNCAPDDVDYVIPGNDDAMRAIALYAAGIADAVIEGRAQVPAVVVGEDEFVELDETGQPEEEGCARPTRRRRLRRCAAAGLRTRTHVAVAPWSRVWPPSRRTADRTVRRRCRGAAQHHGQRRPFAYRYGQCAHRASRPRRWWRTAPRLSAATVPTIRGVEMTVTAEAVKQLRERTGAGMMECKKALVETNGDLDAAAEIMRKPGLAKADKKASRIAAEGVIVVEKSADGKTGVLVEVNCETDFVARGDDFRGFANDVAQGRARGRRRQRRGGQCAEAVERRNRRRAASRADRQDRREPHRAPRHAGEGADAGGFVRAHRQQKAALVALEGGDADLARDLAMQVVAASPRYLTPGDAPADMVAKEREIVTEKAKTEPASSKPAEILAKIVEGRLRKSINEFALTGQVFVKDRDLTIEKLLKDRARRASRRSSASKSAPASKRSRTISSPKSWRRSRRRPRPTRRRPSTRRLRKPRPQRGFLYGKVRVAARAGEFEAIGKPLQTHPGQALGRGAARQCRLRHRSGGDQAHRGRSARDPAERRAGGRA